MSELASEFTIASDQVQDYEFRVTLMSRALANHNPRCTKTEETSRRGANQSRVRVHRTRQVFYQVWF